MAESGNAVGLVTGRQSAHIKIIRRYPDGRIPDEERRKPRAMPELSVVEWEAHEEVCKPCRIKALVSTSGPVSRKDILGQWMRFSFQPEAGGVRREYSGFVSRVQSVSRSRDGCTYRVVARQILALLDGPSNCATYQNKTSADIIQEVIGRTDLKPWIRVVTRLRRQHPKHAFRFQYNMGDWDYCRLEMEQAGLFCFTETDRHGEVLVIADDIDGYTRPAIELKERPASGLHTFCESIFSLKVKTRTVPASFVAADYNPDNAWELHREEGRARNKFSAEDETGMMVGTPMVWGTHHEDAEGAKREAVLRHEAARSQQVSYKVKSTMPSVRPGCIVKPDTFDGTDDSATLDTAEGVFVWKVVHRGARNQNYRNSFRAIPASRPYRLPIDESKWPRVHTLGFTVTSPDKYTYPYLDAEGRIIVRFHCDFGNWPKGGESIPLRMAKPFASKNRSGLNLPPVDGDHGIAGFYESNPNKPFALAFLPSSVNPDLINSSRRRMSRSEIRTRGGNKMWMDDWEGQRGIELSTEESGRSQLNLGFIPDGELKERGRGAEVRTGDHLVGRGGKGVMVTAYDQGGGQGKVLAMDETDAQLRDHQALSKSLADSADASKATPADTDAQKAIDDGLHALKKPGVLVTGPGPVGIASGDGVHVAADGSLVATTKKGMHFSTLRRLTVAARDWVSLFSQKGMNLITAAGDFVAQAQRGRMQLASQGDMTVESVDGVLHVKAAKEIVLNCGGTYMKLSPGGIEFGSRGGAVFKTTGLKKIGPAQMDLGGAAFAPKFVPYTTGCEVWRTNPNFVQEVAGKPAPDPAQWQGLANTGAVAPAPSLDAGSMASAGGGATQGIGTPLPPLQTQRNRASGTVGKEPNLTISDPEGAPKDITLPKESDGRDGDNYVTDPVKLEDAVPCNWVMPSFNGTYDHDMETRAYYPWVDETTKFLRDGVWEKMGGRPHSIFDVKYDDTTKTLTAFVTIGVILKDIHEVDPESKEPVKLKNGNVKSVPYDSSSNGSNTPKNQIPENIKFVDRDKTDFNFADKEKLIRDTLNQNSFKLILDGCSKGAKCGCRIAVKFDVKFKTLKPSEANSSECSKVINLYPYAYRDDSGNWGEVVAAFEEKTGKYTFYGADYTAAHECGHLFNYPDEYYREGGAAHEQYIENEQLQFAKGHALNGTPTWQLFSPGNLMGAGARSKIAGGAKPAISPYYMEYLRRWMTRHTNKKWRVGSSNL